MFTRNHPYKMPASLHPASLRMPGHLSAPKLCFEGPDFTNARSPDSSPLNSPVKGQQFSDGDAPPAFRLVDLLAFGIGRPKRPFTRTPDDPRNATSNAWEVDPFAQDPSAKAPRRKGPKYVSFTSSGRVRSDRLPPRRRAQQLKEKRDTARKRGHERRGPLTRMGIGSLRTEAESLMKPDHMTAQDRVFLKQLSNLQADDEMKLDLEECRQRMARAAGESEQRRQRHEKRDKEAAKRWGKRQDDETIEERRRKVEEFAQAREESMVARILSVEEEALHADEERQRAHAVMEREIREEQERVFRQEMARRAKEEEGRRMQEERERRLREERERRLLEKAERRMREEIERVRRETRERAMREEQERRAREDKERRIRDARERELREELERLRRQARQREACEQQEHRAHLHAEQLHQRAMEEQIRQYFALYEAKWNELRTNSSIPPIDVREMPWPVLSIVSSPDQITHADVRTFLFHPLRPGVEGKSARDKVKSEVLRFHPDKFNTRIVPKIQQAQQTVAKEIAGAVARILTTIMTEEMQK